MKNLKTIIVILLNVLFCAAVLWFFANNSFLRPYTRMPLKESVLALFLLGSLYLNYYFLYPKLFHKYPYIYWLMVVLIALIVTLIDLAVAYPQIVLYNEEVIQLVGPFNFFSVIVLFVSGRNLSFNFFPYLLRERKHYRQSMNNEVRVVTGMLENWMLRTKTTIFGWLTLTTFSIFISRVISPKSIQCKTRNTQDMVP